MKAIPCCKVVSIRKAPGLLLSLLLLSACASSESAAEAPETRVEVDNRSDYIVTIYVIREDSERVRLGQVSPYDEDTFVIPRRLVRGLTSLRFLADPLAGNERPISEEILVEPGDTVGLTIPRF